MNYFTFSRKFSMLCFDISMLYAANICKAYGNIRNFLLGGRNMKNSLSYYQFFLTSALSFASGAADSNAAADVKIDFRMNIAKQDYESNYFN